MASRKRGSKYPAPPWAWMLFGLSIGLGVALVVYLQSGDGAIEPARPESATAERAPAGAAASSTAANSATAGSTSASGSPLTAEAAELAEASEAAEEDFSFFRLLRESEVVVPDNGSAIRAEAGPAQEYVIQAGSYREWADADRAQARLALLGIESKLERAIVGNEIYHRVIIGPLRERDEIATTVRRLNAARIDSLPPRPVAN